jgi:hypothetical protein
MDKMKMAACGIDCSECAEYKVTMEHDLKAAESLVDWFRSRGWIGKNEGAEAVVKKNPLCKGCWSDYRWNGCGGTDFRMCCERKEINHCGECGDFPCESYKGWGHENAIKHLLSLKQTHE